MSQKQFLLSFLLTCAALLFHAESVFACSCAPNPTVLESYDRAEVVVIARAMSVEKAAATKNQRWVDGVRSTTMVVEKVFKGNVKVRDQLVFAQGGGADCSWTFNEESVGEKFLFYLLAPKQSSQLWYPTTCDRSAGLEHATEDLLYLENMRKLRGKTRISGSISSWRNSELIRGGTKVRIIGAKKTWVTKTDRHGVFEIYDLPAGRYLIEPRLPAGWKIVTFRLSYSEGSREEEELKSPKQVPIVLKAKKHAGVTIYLEIDGPVRGPDGKPMP